jgi:cytochrome P450
LLACDLEDVDGTVRPLTDLEVIGMVGLISHAGNETVARMLGWAAVVLAANPSQRAELVADPTLVPDAIEELLRYEAPAPVEARYVTRDVELHGEVVPERATMALLAGSAGRDERQYVDPDRFDVHRRAERHLSFGYGAHYCLGAALARLEGRVAIEETLRRFPEWDVDHDRVTLVSTHTVRGPASVPMRV